MDLCGWKGFFVVLRSLNRHNLGSDTRNDVKPKERIELRREMKEQSTHGWDARARTAVRSRQKLAVLPG